MFMSLILHALILSLLGIVHLSASKVHFSNYRLGTNIKKYLSLAHVFSNNCSHLDEFYFLHFLSSFNNYNTSSYGCIQDLDTLSASIETCTTSCVTQHWIYNSLKHEKSSNVSEILLNNKTPNYSNDIIHFTFVYNISVPKSQNMTITSIIPTVILPNYRNYLIPVMNTTAFSKYNETMTQVTLYFDYSEYTVVSLSHQMSKNCDLFMRLEILPSEIELYLTAVLTSNDGRQIFLYLDKNLQGYLCLDSSTYDKSMNPLKLTLSYKYNIDDSYKNISMQNISSTIYESSDSISFSVEYGYDYIKSYSKFYFCQSINIQDLMFGKVQTVSLTMMSKSDYFTANNDLYDVNIINISDSQTLLCFVISTVFESIVLIVALKKILNLSNMKDKKIFNICLTWLIFMDYFIISGYALYLHQLYTGNGDKCGQYRNGSDSGQILDLNYEFMWPLSFILVNQLFELRLLLFNRHLIPSWGYCACSCTCLETCCIDSKTSHKLRQYNVDIISMNAFACAAFVRYGKEFIEIINDYNQCKLNNYAADWYCESEGQRAKNFGIGFVTCLAFGSLIWLNRCLLITTTHDARKLKLKLLTLFVVFCCCFVFGAVSFYFTNVNRSWDYNIYTIISWVWGVIFYVFFALCMIKPILLMFGCMPRSIYTLIAFFFIVSSIYLNVLVAQTHNAPYAPFIIILTPIAMIMFVWSLNKYSPEFKDGIVVIQSIFLQLLGMHK